MANKSVFTGADGSLNLSAPETPEGAKAKAVLEEFELITVGRVQDVRLEVTSDVKAYHEIGQRYATELRPGNININGTIGRAYINGAMLKLLLGEAAGGRPAGSWAQPAFNITLLLENAATPEVSNTVTLHEVKINNWVYSVPEDDFVMESVNFMAAYMTVEDEA